MFLLYSYERTDDDDVVLVQVFQMIIVYGRIAHAIIKSCWSLGSSFLPAVLPPSPFPSPQTFPFPYIHPILQTQAGQMNKKQNS